MTREALIADLEKAERGSRELSDRVLLALGWRHELATGLIHEPGTMIWKAPGGIGAARNRPSPTQSVDDALALVPEGWGWIISRFLELRIGLQGFTCVLERPTGDGDREPIGFMTMPAVVAATPALALCIAILRTLPNGESND